MRITYSNFIVLGAVVGALIGVSYSMLIQPVFIAESSIRIGSIGLPTYQLDQDCDDISQILIENRHSLRKILYWRFRIHEARLNRLQLPFLTSALPDDSPDLVKLSARGRTPDEAIQFLKSVNKWVEERHRKKYEIAIKELQNHIQVIKQFIVDSKLIHAVNASSDAEVQEGIPKNLTPTKQTGTPLELMLQKIAQVEFSTLSLNSYTTEIVSEPNWTGQKSKPKKLLYTLTGLIAGIVAAIFGIGIYREIQLHRLTKTDDLENSTIRQ